MLNAEFRLRPTLAEAHGRYAAYWNGHRSSTGHVWRGRFYSCPLDEKHLWEALRYVELNPVRAQMVAHGDATGVHYHWWHYNQEKRGKKGQTELTHFPLSHFGLSDHFESGQRLSLQNQPTEVAVQD